MAKDIRFMVLEPRYFCCNSLAQLINRVSSPSAGWSTSTSAEARNLYGIVLDSLFRGFQGNDEGELQWSKAVPYPRIDIQSPRISVW